MEKQGTKNKIEIEAINIAVAFIVIGLIIFGFLYFAGKTSENMSSGAVSSGEVATTTFYTQSDANIRSCASTNCPVLETVGSNSVYTFWDATTTDGLPEWVEETLSQQDYDRGVSPQYTTGYINKINLGENPVAIQTSQTPDTQVPAPSTDNSITQNSPPTTLPSIVQEWQKSTAYVECYWVYNNDVWYFKESGSGLLTTLNSVPTVITNKHVVDNPKYGLANECDFAFPKDNGAYYSITTWNQSSIVDIPAHGQITFSADGSDVAYLSDMEEQSMGSSPSISLENRARTSNFVCDANPPTGEPIAVLGYPDYGTNAGTLMSVFSTIDPTVTEGIIAGQDGIYLTTSAKIDPGNSGGLAIDETNDCYIGIPTAIQIGEAGTLGRILPASYAITGALK